MPGRPGVSEFRLTAGISNLDTCLTDVDGDDFAHYELVVVKSYGEASVRSLRRVIESIAHGKEFLEEERMEE
jgi:hypothetical protein